MEYNYALTILAADKVMVKHYNDMRIGELDMMQDILRNRTKEELQNETLMLTELKAYVDEILSYMQTPEVSIAIEYAYFPLPADSGNGYRMWFRFPEFLLGIIDGVISRIGFSLIFFYIFNAGVESCFLGTAFSRTLTGVVVVAYFLVVNGRQGSGWLIRKEIYKVGCY